MSVKKEFGLTFHLNADVMVWHCDVVAINRPFDPETDGQFNDVNISDVHISDTEPGAYSCDRDAMVRALQAVSSQAIRSRRPLSE